MDEFKPPEDQTPSPEEAQGEIPAFLPEDQNTVRNSSPAPKSDNSGEMAKGMKLIGFCHLALIVFLGLPSLINYIVNNSRTGRWDEILPTVGFGVTVLLEVLAVIQFVYVLPAIIVTLCMKKNDMALGIASAMGLTILLGGASFAVCTVVTFSHMGR